MLPSSHITMDIPRIIPLSNSSRIVFELDTTQEQRLKVIKSYNDEEKEKIDKAHRHPLFMEVKNFLRIFKDEIFNDPDNAHLRRNNREVIK